MRKSNQKKIIIRCAANTCTRRTCMQVMTNKKRYCLTSQTRFFLRAPRSVFLEQKCKKEVKKKTICARRDDHDSQSSSKLESQHVEASKHVNDSEEECNPSLKTTQTNKKQPTNSRQGLFQHLSELKTKSRKQLKQESV